MNTSSSWNKEQESQMQKTKPSHRWRLLLALHLKDVFSSPKLMIRRAKNAPADSASNASMVVASF